MDRTSSLVYYSCPLSKCHHVAFHGSVFDSIFCDCMLHVECECDIGGAYNNVCNKTSGQCDCKGNITQRQCDRFIVQSLLTLSILLIIQ